MRYYRWYCDVVVMCVSCVKWLICLMKDKFWSSIKAKRRKKSNSFLQPSKLADYYSSIMQDNAKLTEEQQRISIDVHNKYKNNEQYVTESCMIKPSLVSDLISRLKRSSSPGVDSICSEHFIYGNSPTLCEILSCFYSSVLNRGCVPKSFLKGILIPILKKTNLNPNVPENYRPIPLSSTHSKLIEMLIMPKDELYDTQFGFRESRGTSMPCVLINDIASYFNDRGSPLYICSLDAEKCFDSIWHGALLYKLWEKLPLYHWLLMYRWYNNLKAVFRWNGECSYSFNVTRGTRQGSRLSPHIFGIFINDLLIDLSTSDHGVHGVQINLSHLPMRMI